MAVERFRRYREEPSRCVCGLSTRENAVSQRPKREVPLTPLNDSTSIRPLASGAVLRVPPPWLNRQTILALLASLLFGLCGAGFEAALLNGQFAPGDDGKEFPFWSIHGMCGLSILLGAFGVCTTFLTMFCRTEFRADADHFYRLRRWGLFRKEQSWRRCGLIGPRIRLSEGSLGKCLYAKLTLELDDGQNVRLLPDATAESLQPICGELQNLLAKDSTPRIRTEEFPLGAFLRIQEHSGTIRLHSGPINPSAVTGSFYVLGAMSVFGAPLFLLLVAIDAWQLMFHQATGIRVLAELLIAALMIGCVIAGTQLRGWVRRLAQTQYDLTIDAEQARLITTFAGSVKTWQANTAEIKQIECNAFKDSDSSGKIIAVIHIITYNGKNANLMEGHPFDEIDWLVDHLRTRLKLNAPAMSCTVNTR